MIVIKKKHSVLIASWKLLVVFSYAIRVLWDIYWRFEALDQLERDQRLQAWCWKMLRVLGVEVEQTGDQMLEKGCLRASNHVSWLDIVVIYACSPCRFIAKAEIRNFPVIGRIARNTGTLFIDRGNIKDAIRISEQVAGALKEGYCIAFFPEGTTSEGEGLLPLHPSLFESALGAQSFVQTVVLRFHVAASTRAAQYAAYVKNSLFVTLWHILRVGGVYASVTTQKAFQAQSTDTRHTICEKVQAEMEAVLNRLNYNPEDLVGVTQDTVQMKLQFTFIDDALLWLQDAEYKLRQLKEKAYDAATLSELRQLVHLIKGGAASVGFAHYSEAAKILEVCLNRWMKTKEAITLETGGFIEQALRELRRGQSMLPNGDIQQRQVCELLEEAKEVVAPQIIEPYMAHLATQKIVCAKHEKVMN